MKANTSLPSSYSEYTVLEPSKNPKLVIGAVVTGIALLLISCWLLVLFTNTIRPVALDGIRLRDFRATPTATFLVIPPALLRDLLVALIAVLIIHELVHGLLYWLLSGKLPKFGIQGLFPYAAAPMGVYFPRNEFLTVGLAPLVLLTAVGLLLIVIAPIPFVPFLLFFVALNAGGAGGDLIMVIRLMSFSSDSVMQDNDARVTVYEPKRNTNVA
jgi:hypothetical protein